MDPTEVQQILQAGLALGVCVLVPWIMQLLKGTFPTLICGKVMKRALVFLMSAGAVLGIQAWMGNWPPSPLLVIPATVSLYLASEGAYRKMVRTDARQEAPDG